jgi:hypothetical protein
VHKVLDGLFIQALQEAPVLIQDCIDPLVDLEILWAGMSRDIDQ